MSTMVSDTIIVRAECFPSVGQPEPMTREHALPYLGGKTPEENEARMRAAEAAWELLKTAGFTWMKVGQVDEDDASGVEFAVE